MKINNVDQLIDPYYPHSTIGIISLNMSDSRKSEELLVAVNAALERMKTLEILILSWEERLRACELRSLTSISPRADTLSSASSFVDEPISLVSLPLHGGGYMSENRCAVKSCAEEVTADKRFCRRHATRACQHPGCTKTRLGPQYCIRHGGGKRCEVPGCTKGASGTIGGGAHFCIAHGGGRRCRIEGCQSTAKRGGLCSSHGGRYECVIPGCTKTAHGPRRLCTTHGGGRPSSSV